MGIIVNMDSLYDSKATATRIYKMSELLSACYVSLREYMFAHVDRMAVRNEELR